jgi:hypothetical protein
VDEDGSGMWAKMGMVREIAARPAGELRSRSRSPRPRKPPTPSILRGCVTSSGIAPRGRGAPYGSPSIPAGRADLRPTDLRAVG